MIFKNNKGQESGFETIIYAVAFIFAAAILFFVLYYIFGQIKAPVSDALTNSMSDKGATFNVTNFNTETTGGISTFNIIFPFLLIGVIIMVGVSLFYIRSNPGFFFISLIIFGVVILLSVIFSNVYQAVSTDSNFGNTHTTFNVIEFVMKNLPVIVIVLIVVGIIFLYAKPDGGGGL